MVMMCKYLTGKLPFKEVYLHSLVRDAHGRKMSKSLGNVVDPLSVRDGVTLKQLQDSLTSGNLDPKEIKKAQAGQAADFPNGIPQCGVDALRFSLCAFVSNSGKDINLDVSRIVGYRQFCNKVWNAIKFVLMSLEPNNIPAAKEGTTGAESRADLWILSRLASAVSDFNSGMFAYDFQKATTAVYNFWYYDLCATYVEWSKPSFWGDDGPGKESSKATLYTCAESGLRLLAPLMPFVAEELWQRLPRRADDPPSIVVAKFPTDSSARNEALEREIAFVQEVINGIRAMKASVGMKPSAKPSLFFRGGNKIETLAAFSVEIKALAKVETPVVLCAEDPAPTGCAVTSQGGTEVHMMVKGVVDVAVELAKVAKEKTQLESRIKTEIDFFTSSAADRMPEDKLKARKAKAVVLKESLAALKKSEVMYTALL